MTEGKNEAAQAVAVPTARVPDPPEIPPELASQNDRACAIVAGALLDQLLERLLRLRLVPGAIEPLFAGKYGPLSSFAAKIDFAVAIGLITSSEGRDLHRIRRIRNEFSHSLTSLSFNMPPISQHVGQLVFASSNILKRRTHPRTDFQTCVVIMSGTLKKRIDSVSALHAPRDELQGMLGRDQESKGDKDRKQIANSRGAKEEKPAGKKAARRSGA